MNTIIKNAKSSLFVRGVYKTIFYFFVRKKTRENSTRTLEHVLIFFLFGEKFLCVDDNMTIIGRKKKGFENRLFEIRKRGYTRRSVLLLLYIIYIYIYISHSSHTKTHSLLVLVAPWWDLRLGGIGLNGLLVH